MRIIRYLKESKVAVLLITLLLIVQAFADLSLPRYTADLVDVGIQQGGIDNASPDTISQDSFNYVCMLAPDQDEQLIINSYTQNDDGTYRINDTGAAQRDALNSAMALPMVMIHFADLKNAAGAMGEGVGTQTELAPEAIDFAKIYEAYQAGAFTKQDVESYVDQAKQMMGGVDDSLIQQQAIVATKAEYQALGMDMGAIQIRYLVILGAQMLGVAALMMAASIAVGFLASRTAAKTARNLRKRLFSKVVSFSDREVQSFSAASLITRGTNDIQQIQMVLVMLLRMVLYAPILAIGGIIMVSQTNIAMSWIIVLAIVVIALVIGLLIAIAMPKFKIMQKLIDRVNLVAREMLTGLSVVRAFDRQDFEEARFDKASTKLYRTQLFTNRVMTFMFPTMMLVMNGVSVLIVWVGGSYIDSGVIQTGDMIAFITYSMVIVMSFLMISMICIMLPRADVAAQRVNEVLSTDTSIKDPKPGESKAAAFKTDTQGLQVQFDDVTFIYNEGSDPVLSHISFTAEPGQTTAIIGPTGSGKSTLMKLIERFYDVTSGAIRVGGVDVRDVTQHELRHELGYVPQKAFLFSGTIESTIAYANSDIPQDRVEEAAEIAQARDFIGEKTEGFNAPIAQGGTNVSGGQRQRLSIARALATDARVLLFDDSFSALDYATDAKLRHALAKYAGGKTVLVVAQRISTVLNADKIVVLDEGKIVGIGTHRELMESCLTYQEIAESQLSEEELKGGVA
ncbi:MAG: ABC transporter ATP-binding protein [Eggerthellaceae bacterium]